MLLFTKFIYKYCLTIILLAMIFLNYSCTNYHPFPDVAELYEAKDPDTNEPAVQLVVKKWTDGDYTTPIVKFVDSNGCTWAIGCYSESPEMWSIMRICKGEKQEVSFQKIFTTRARPTWLEHSEFNDYKNWLEYSEINDYNKK